MTDFYPSYVADFGSYVVLVTGNLESSIESEYNVQKHEARYAEYAHTLAQTDTWSHSNVFSPT